MTPEEYAATRLEQILDDIDRTGTTDVSLRERLDLYYAATETTADHYDPDVEDDDVCFCCT